MSHVNVIQHKLVTSIFIILCYHSNKKYNSPEIPDDIHLRCKQRKHFIIEVVHKYTQTRPQKERKKLVPSQYVQPQQYNQTRANSAVLYKQVLSLATAVLVSICVCVCLSVRDSWLQIKKKETLRLIQEIINNKGEKW